MEYSGRMAKGKSTNISDQLRHAILHSGLTHYRIALDAGIATPMLDRFVSGERDLRLESAAKIARVLKLELRERGIG
jgi:hypothetical protein